MIRAGVAKLVVAATMVASIVVAVGASSAAADDPAAPPGLDFSTRSWDALVADFDDDGYDDVLIGRHGLGLYPGPDDELVWVVKRDVIRYWRDGVYEDGFVLPAGDRHGCDAADVNLDGRLDIYCMRGADGGAGTKANELWIQQPDGDFHDNSQQALRSGHQCQKIVARRIQ